MLTMAKPLDSFDELIVRFQTLGKPLDEARQLVILLDRLSSKFKLISSIVKEFTDVALIEVKEKKLLMEDEGQEKKKFTKRAYKVNTGRLKGCHDNGQKGSGPQRNDVGFKGGSFKCGLVGHLKRGCPKRHGTRKNEAVFAACEGRCAGWRIDSGAKSHNISLKKSFF